MLRQQPSSMRTLVSDQRAAGPAHGVEDCGQPRRIIVVDPQNTRECFLTADERRSRGLVKVSPFQQLLQQIPATLIACVPVTADRTAHGYPSRFAISTVICHKDEFPPQPVGGQSVSTISAGRGIGSRRKFGSFPPTIPLPSGPSLANGDASGCSIAS